jgi:phosphatidylglycerophosphatase A
VCGAIVVAGAWSARITEEALGVEDPGPVVIDEVVGMFVSLLWLPATWPVILAAFLAFRVFDIVKPWPAGRLEHVPGGWGVMADDVMAGVYANLAVQILIWARPGLLT